MERKKEEEEGEHVTVPPPLGFCATKSKANGGMGNRNQGAQENEALDTSTIQSTITR
jgi:hypothetical protein